MKMEMQTKCFFKHSLFVYPPMKIFFILLIINNAGYTRLCVGTDAYSVGSAGGM